MSDRQDAKDRLAYEHARQRALKSSRSSPASSSSYVSSKPPRAWRRTSSSSSKSHRSSTPSYQYDPRRPYEHDPSEDDVPDATWDGDSASDTECESHASDDGMLRDIVAGQTDHRDRLYTNEYYLAQSQQKPTSRSPSSSSTSSYTTPSSYMDDSYPQQRRSERSISGPGLGLPGHAPWVTSPEEHGSVATYTYPSWNDCTSSNGHVPRTTVIVVQPSVW